VADEQKTPELSAPVERRVAALEQAFEERNLIPAGFTSSPCGGMKARTFMSE
jgi:hypothetical protein